MSPLLKVYNGVLVQRCRLQYNDAVQRGKGSCRIGSTMWDGRAMHLRRSSSLRCHQSKRREQAVLPS